MNIGRRQAVLIVDFAFILTVYTLFNLVIFCNRRLNYFNSKLFLILFFFVCVCVACFMAFSLSVFPSHLLLIACTLKCMRRVSKETRAVQKHTKELFISSDTIKSFIELKQDQRLCRFLPILLAGCTMLRVTLLHNFFFSSSSSPWSHSHVTLVVFSSPLVFYVSQRISAVSRVMFVLHLKT